MVILTTPRNNLVVLGVAAAAAICGIAGSEDRGVAVVRAAAADEDILNYGPAPNVYAARIEPLSAGSSVAGTAVVFLPNFASQSGLTGMVGYTGVVTGVEPDLTAPDCAAKNACGAQILDGTGCDGVDEQVGVPATCLR